MKTIKDLENEIESRYLILVKARDFFEYSKYLNSPETEELKNIANRHTFIRKSRYAFWVVSVLEIMKLFGSKNDEFRFEKLINKLIHNHSKSEWRTYISRDQIKSFESELKSDKITTVISNLKELRDKYYAHSDRNAEEEIDRFVPTFVEFELLLEFSERIINTLSQNMSVIQTHFHSARKTNVLKALNKLTQISNV